MFPLFLPSPQSAVLGGGRSAPPDGELLEGLGLFRLWIPSAEFIAGVQ